MFIRQRLIRREYNPYTLKHILCCSVHPCFWFVREPAFNILSVPSYGYAFLALNPFYRPDGKHYKVNVKTKFESF